MFKCPVPLPHMKKGTVPSYDIKVFALSVK